jgi:hypothetical protein
MTSILEVFLKSNWFWRTKPAHIVTLGHSPVPTIFKIKLKKTVKLLPKTSFNLLQITNEL